MNWPPRDINRAAELMDEDATGVLEAPGAYGEGLQDHGPGQRWHVHLHQSQGRAGSRSQKLLADTAAEELKGEEGEALLKAFRDEAEAAEQG